MVEQLRAKRKAFKLKGERVLYLTEGTGLVLYLPSPHCFLFFVFLQVMFH